MRAFALGKVSFFVVASLSLSAQADDTLPATVQQLISTSLGQSDNHVQVMLRDYPEKLANCEQPEAFLPFRVTAGGRATIGVRCRGREQRPLYLPVDVKVLGNYWVPIVDIPRGAVIDTSMLSEKTGDLAKLPRNIIQDPAMIIGQQVNRTLKSGKPVQKSSIQAINLVKRNTSVDVQATGVGFMIKREGIAMDDGGLGSVVRVKLKGGDVIKAVVAGNNVLNIDI